MILDDKILLNQHGGSHCFIVPSKYLKEFNLDKLKFAMHLRINGRLITLEPLDSRYEANQIVKGGQIMASPVHLSEQSEPTKDTT